MSFLSYAKSYKNTLMLGAMLAAGVGLTGGDDEKGGIEPNPEPTLPLSDKALVVPVSSVKLGDVGDQLLFTATYLPGETSWVNMSTQVVDNGDVSVQIQGVDSISVNSLGTVNFFNTRGSVTAHIESIKVSDGKEIYTTMDLNAQRLAYLTDNIAMATNFIKKAEKEPFKVKIKRFDGKVDNSSLVVLFPK